MTASHARNPAESSGCTHDAVPLSTLPAGTCALVARAVMPGEEGELLAAMGLTARCPLRVCRAGDPCIIEVASTRLGLSAAMARKVLVQPTAGAPPIIGVPS